MRILVVDDHEIVRAGLRTVLEGESDIEVVGEASTEEEAIAQAMALVPDIVLMDVRLDERQAAGSGIEACRAVRSMLPGTNVLMFSSYSEREAVVASILAGAVGFVTKNVGRAQLLEALRAAGRGESLLDTKVAGEVMASLKELSRTAPAQGDGLSAREREVLALIAQGMTNRQIADKLVISPHTARNHVTNILDKLGFSRRSEAAAFAARHGLVDD